MTAGPRDSQDQMTFRMPPGAVAGPAQEAVSVQPPRAAFNIVILSMGDGAELLTMREEGGRLVIGGDESRWDEGAKAFLHQMMQWSGQVGIRWRAEVIRAADGP